jgi:hypothetical protein
MDEYDLHDLRRLVLHHGIAEVLQGLSTVCEYRSTEIAPMNAHEALTLTHVSVSLITIVAEIEDEPTSVTG